MSTHTCGGARPAPTDACRDARLLLATTDPDARQRCIVALREAGAHWHASHGLLVVCTPHGPAPLLRHLSGRLSAAELGEVRALIDVDDDPAETLLARAMRASSLGRLAAQHRQGALQQMLRTGEGLFSEYQPIVALPSREVVAYEALLRGEVEGERISPGELFEAAAEAGWSDLLDRMGQVAAIRGASPWIGDRQLFINFLPSSVARPAVGLRAMEAALARSALSPRQLVFEVVETEKVDDIDHLNTILDHLRARGARVALDDLGAGYASLNLLARVKPDVVKIDRELVQALPDPAATAVLRAVVEMSRDLGAQVLAEGVETQAQHERVQALGVDLGQGWFYGRPSRPAVRAETEGVDVTEAA